MKRILACLLTFVIVLGLCACSNSGSGETTQPAVQGLQIGYARESLIPSGNVNMSGYGNQEHRISTGYLDIIAATCIAASENGNTVLLYSTDTLNSKSNGGYRRSRRQHPDRRYPHPLQRRGGRQ